MLFDQQYLWIVGYKIIQRHLENLDGRYDWLPLVVSVELVVEGISLLIVGVGESTSGTKAEGGNVRIGC